MYPKGNLLISSPHGQIEAIYRPHARDVERVALILHPHPLFGGTMHNKVVYRAAKALEEAGFTTLRFNFRGVGESTGQHDDGRGEVDDARLALDHLLTDQPKAREVVIAGFSFGAAVGLQLGCDDDRAQQVVAIGTPLRIKELAFLDSCRKPKLFIHGEQDKIAPLKPLEERLERLPTDIPWKLIKIPGAEHFFDNHLDELKDVLRREFSTT
ncbi:MAG: alpha/beta fold hydrolase [Acidobacteriota bacterium]